MVLHLCPFLYTERDWLWAPSWIWPKSQTQGTGLDLCGLKQGQHHQGPVTGWETWGLEGRLLDRLLQSAHCSQKFPEVVTAGGGCSLQRAPGGRWAGGCGQWDGWGRTACGGWGPGRWSCAAPVPGATSGKGWVGRRGGCARGTAVGRCPRRPALPTLWSGWSLEMKFKLLVNSRSLKKNILRSDENASQQLQCSFHNHLSIFFLLILFLTTHCVILYFKIKQPTCSFVQCSLTVNSSFLTQWGSFIRLRIKQKQKSSTMFYCPSGPSGL